MLGIQNLCYGLKTLEGLLYLDLSGNSIGSDGLKVLSIHADPLKSLHTLKLSSNLITKQGPGMSLIC